MGDAELAIKLLREFANVEQYEPRGWKTTGAEELTHWLADNPAWQVMSKGGEEWKQGAHLMLDRRNPARAIVAYPPVVVYAGLDQVFGADWGRAKRAVTSWVKTCSGPGGKLEGAIAVEIRKALGKRGGGGPQWKDGEVHAAFPNLKQAWAGTCKLAARLYAEEGLCWSWSWHGEDEEATRDTSMRMTARLATKAEVADRAQEANEAVEQGRRLGRGSARAMDDRQGRGSCCNNSLLPVYKKRQEHLEQLKSLGLEVPPPEAIMRSSTSCEQPEPPRSHRARALSDVSSALNQLGCTLMRVEEVGRACGARAPVRVAVEEKRLLEADGRAIIRLADEAHGLRLGEVAELLAELELGDVPILTWVGGKVKGVQLSPTPTDRMKLALVPGDPAPMEGWEVARERIIRELMEAARKIAARRKAFEEDTSTAVAPSSALWYTPPTEPGGIGHVDWLRGSSREAALEVARVEWEAWVGAPQACLRAGGDGRTGAPAVECEKEEDEGEVVGEDAVERSHHLNWKRSDGGGGGGGGAGAGGVGYGGDGGGGDGGGGGGGSAGAGGAGGADDGGDAGGDPGGGARSGGARSSGRSRKAPSARPPADRPPNLLPPRLSMRDLLVAQAPNGTVDFDTFMATHATEWWSLVNLPPAAAPRSRPLQTLHCPTHLLCPVFAVEMCHRRASMQQLQALTSELSSSSRFVRGTDAHLSAGEFGEVLAAANVGMVILRDVQFPEGPRRCAVLLAPPATAGSGDLDGFGVCCEVSNVKDRVHLEAAILPGCDHAAIWKLPELLTVLERDCGIRDVLDACPTSLPAGWMAGGDPAKKPKGSEGFVVFMAQWATTEKATRATASTKNGFNLRHPLTYKQIGTGRFQTREQYLAVLPLVYHTADAVRPPAQ